MRPMQSIHLPIVRVDNGTKRGLRCALVSINPDGSVDVVPLSGRSPMKRRQNDRGYAVWNISDGSEVAKQVAKETLPDPVVVDESTAFARAAMYSDAYLALMVHHGNRTLAAERVGISRQAMTDRVRSSGWLETLFPHRDGRPAKG